MIKLLANIFIKNNQDFRSPIVREGYGILCGTVGIIFNLLLSAGKFIAGTLSGSIAITADALNNLSDAGSSVITLIGFRIAGQKPDKDHPFGHGRFEYVSGLIVSLIILVMGVELLKTSVEKIITPEESVFSVLSFVILGISVAVKLYMAIYNYLISKKIGSAAMKATAADSISDTVATFVVIVSALITKLSGINTDGFAGIAVSLFILYTGFKSAKDTISPLLGQPPENEFVEHIDSIVMSHDAVLGIHDLIVHDYGPGRRIISLHAEVSAKADMLKTHDVIDNIEKDLSDELGCSAVIHMDPVITDDEISNELKQQVTEIVKQIEPSVTIHDFRMVTGPSHTNIIFDLVLPFGTAISDSYMKKEISERIKKLDPSYFAVVNIDKTYVL